MIAVLVGIVALIAVLTLTGALRFGDGSPESVVQSYADAVEKGDFTKASGLCTGDNMAAYNNIQEAGYNQIKASYPNFNYTIEILELKTTFQTATETTLYIRERETVSNAGIYNTSAEYSGNVYLTKVGNEWKISNMVVT